MENKKPKEKIKVVNIYDVVKSNDIILIFRKRKLMDGYKIK